ncbi:MAG: hypothetical protein ACRDL8_21525, partial [Solirubrobacteraceae bacterium]
MDAWTFVWLFFILKIPIVALFLLVRWAVREPDAEPSDDGGIGVGANRVDGGPIRPRHPHHPRSPRGGRSPIIPRRGAHGDPMPVSPPRMRTVLA